MITKQLHHPSALDMFDQIIDASKGKQIVMFLDYDGTLSPIVEDPDRAFMSHSVSFILFHVSQPWTYYPYCLINLQDCFLCVCFYQMRKTVRKLARCFPTAIVTGRCKDKVQYYLG